MYVGMPKMKSLVCRDIHLHLADRDDNAATIDWCDADSVALVDATCIPAVTARPRARLFNLKAPTSACIDQTLPETRLQFIAIKVAADEDHPVHPGLFQSPLSTFGPIEKHVHTVEYVLA